MANCHRESRSRFAKWGPALSKRALVVRLDDERTRQESIVN